MASTLSLLCLRVPLSLRGLRGADDAPAPRPSAPAHAPPSQGTLLRGVTKKGKAFFRFETGLTEPVTRFAVHALDIDALASHTLAHYKECKDGWSYTCEVRQQMCEFVHRNRLPLGLTCTCKRARPRATTPDPPARAVARTLVRRIASRISTRSRWAAAMPPRT